MVSGYDIDSIDRSEVLRYLGYAGQPITTELDARIDDVVSRCIRIGRARGIWRIFDVAGAGTKDDGTPFVSLAGTSLELPGRSMEEHMAGAVAVGVMAVTVGMGVERELRRLSLTDHVEQVIFDAAATTLVERAADACEADVIAGAAGRGLFCNGRFSPGYGDMPLEVQPVLLATLDAPRRLGIMLSSTLLMTPTKSVTAVMGVFRDPHRSSHPNCADCLCHDFCTIRTSGRTCRG